MIHGPSVRLPSGQRLFTNFSFPYSGGLLFFPVPGQKWNAGSVNLAQSAFQDFGFITSNPSLENVTEGPPWLPAKHLSGPETHPTPGHQTYEPGHSACLETPARKKTTMATIATAIYQVQRGICISSIILLLDIPDIRLELAALYRRRATGVDRNSIQLSQSR